MLVRLKWWLMEMEETREKHQENPLGQPQKQLLFGWWRTSFGTHLFRYISFARHCFLPHGASRHHNVQCTQTWDASCHGCQDVCSTLATDVGWEMPCGEPIDICTCVSNLTVVWKIMWVSRGHWSVHSVNTICCATERIANPPAAACFWLYLRNMPQVVQERWRRCLGSR